MRYLILLVSILCSFSLFGQNIYDYGILNAEIVDGTGAPSYRADVLIREDTIAFIGTYDRDQHQLNQIINGENQILSPGFIDTHAHGDPFESDQFSNFLAMGVTTIILGQDGSSPVHDHDPPSQFFDKLANESLSLNIGFLAGHGSMRARLGIGPGKLSEENRQQLKDLLQEAMEAGCLGMSTGLEYLPGAYAQVSELVDLAQIVGNYDGMIMSHMRSEDDEEIYGAIDELIQQGQHCKVHVSHIKSVYGHGTDRGQEISDYLKKALEQGIHISADVYPYMASYTGLSIVFPSWAKTRSSFETALGDRREELEKYLYDRIMRRNGPKATLFASGPFSGMTLAQIAEKSGKSFVQVLLDLGPVGTYGAYFVMDEALQEVFITDSTTMICSDGSPTMRHPRGYGSFSRVLRKYVQEDQELSLPLAIYKMTSLPARTLGLADRGQIKEGRKADLILFNLDDVKDLANFEEPHVLSQGIERVFINGKLAWEEGNMEQGAGALLKQSKR